MCGIALTTKGSHQVSKMLKALAHRGPDGKGVTINGRVYLGHRRLAIVDTQHPDAVQPYVKDTHYAIAFNGEIFNYKQLTQSTEVALLGELMAAEHDLTQLLNGYYAIAFHDIGRNKIVLARDLYGVMPLYYASYKGHFEAASERKAFEAPQQHVHPVPANSKLEYDLETHKIRITEFSQPFRLGQYHYSTDLFLNAVDRTARHSDAGFSIALSGGLDSSMVLCALKRIGATPEAIITTYTQNEDRSERDRARLLAHKLGWSHRFKEVQVVPLAAADLREAIETPENPIRDFAFLRHLTVAMHSPTKVILCGEGADELGLGYPINRTLNTAYDEYFRKVSLLKSQAAMTLDRVNKAGMRYSKEYRVPFLDVDFSLHALSIRQTSKAVFRTMAHSLGVPAEIINASKYSNEEAVGRACAAARTS